MGYVVRIYDCFLFFNELDLLEIRLNELYDVVDNFVLVECTESFSKKKKTLFFDNNKKRFEKFLDKIIHVVVDDTPDFEPTPGRMGTFHSRHQVEWYQRDSISRGLTRCNIGDIVIVSDVDEIPKKSAIERIKSHFKSSSSFVSLNHRFFYYYLNGLCVQNGRDAPWLGATACKYENFPGAEALRRTRANNASRISDGGWHFSYLGGPEMIALKIESIAHAEWDNDKIKNRERLNKVIEKGEDLFGRADKPKQTYVEIDNTFPNHVFLNQEKYSHIIKRD